MKMKMSFIASALLLAGCATGTGARAPAASQEGFMIGKQGEDWTFITAKYRYSDPVPLNTSCGGYAQLLRDDYENYTLHITGEHCSNYKTDYNYSGKLDGYGNKDRSIDINITSYPGCHWVRIESDAAEKGKKLGNSQTILVYVPHHGWDWTAEDNAWAAYADGCTPASVPVF